MNRYEARQGSFSDFIFSKIFLKNFSKFLYFSNLIYFNNFIGGGVLLISVKGNPHMN